LGNDTFYGGNGNDYVFGGSGNEVYYGEAGNDTLLGWSGNDSITGGVGADYLDGGSGTDMLSYSGSSAAVTVNLLANTATGGDATGDVIVLNSFENLTGSSYNDSLTGNALSNVIYGGGGNDTVNGGDGNDLIYLGDGNDYVNTTALGNDTFYGGNGNDYVFGGSGNEVYYGEAGNDTLLGWSGNDSITGGAGIDLLTGGSGYDRFVFREKGVANRDVITDFSHADDTIVLGDYLDGTYNSAITGLTFNSGVLSSNWYFEGAGSNGNGSQLSGIFVDTTAGNIWYNPTSTTVGDSQLIAVVGTSVVASLDYTDFVYG
jgi:Ca2+-binding RTX toxin-like protein